MRTMNSTEVERLYMHAICEGRERHPDWEQALWLARRNNGDYAAIGQDAERVGALLQKRPVLYRLPTRNINMYALVIPEPEAQKTLKALIDLGGEQVVVSQNDPETGLETDLLEPAYEQMSLV